MSKNSIQTISCPQCSAKFDIVIWDSINISLGPELRAKVIDESIFINECPGCKNSVYVPWDTLYHDMENHFMLFFSHDVTNEESQPNAEIPDYLAQMQNNYNISDEYCYRQVTGIMNLKEKIFIFESQLTDVTIEYLKYLLVNNILTISDLIFPSTDTLRYVKADEEFLYFVHLDYEFHVINEYKITRNVYAFANQKVNSDQRLTAKPMSNINYNWIENQLKQI